MRGYFGNTDYDWYRFLAARPSIEEVNFWQPSGSRAFRAVPEGAPFFFKLKKPHYAVAGFGFFARHSILPAWLAWESFGEGNGATDLATMCARIEKYRKTKPDGSRAAYPIGCLMVAEPVFFPESNWIPQPSDWPMNAVQGATYDLTAGEGQRVFAECLARAAALGVAESPERTASLSGDGPRFGAERLVRPRLGQGIFRIAVTEAYDRSCAVTTEHSLPVLEAAHIKPYAQGGLHEVSNGVLLRRDIHTLFDLGYVTVGADDRRFEVSGRLKEEFENGKTYYAMRGATIHEPTALPDRPSKELLDWHNREVFQG